MNEFSVDTDFIIPHLIPFHTADGYAASIRRDPVQRKKAPPPVPIVHHHARRIFRQVYTIPEIHPAIYPNGRAARKNRKEKYYKKLFSAVQKRMRTCIFHCQPVKNKQQNSQKHIFQIHQPMSSERSRDFRISVQRRFRLDALLPPSLLFHHFQIHFLLFAGIRICGPGILPVPFFYFIYTQYQASHSRQQHKSCNRFCFHDILTIIFL